MIVVLAGATGLVGGRVLNHCLDSPDITQIFAYTRHTTGEKVIHSKLTWLLLSELDHNFPLADALIMTVGTTMAKAGSKEAFLKVDVDIPFQIAKKAREMKVPTLLNVSAKGASSQSVFFYNRAKADLEQKLISLRFEHLVIVRPSLLLGDRAESRPAEWLAQKLVKSINRFIPASVRAVSAESVAACLMRNLFKANLLPAVSYVENADILKVPS